MPIGSQVISRIRAHLEANGWKSLGQMRDAAQVIERIVDEEYGKVKEKRRKSAAFVPPTPEEVTEYSASIGYPMNGQEWCDHYECKNWKTSGSTKMTNWQAAVRKWKSKGWKPGSEVQDAPQRQSASLGALQLQLGRVERELDDILRPGGSALTITPTGEKLERYYQLMEIRKGLLGKIDQFGG